MKIKSTVSHNVSFRKAHDAPKSTADYLTIPAGSTLELDDKTWNNSFAGSKSIAASISTGALEMVEHAASPVSASDMIKLIKSQVGVTVDSVLEKAVIQDLAIKLGVDLTVKVPSPAPKKKKIEES